MCDAYPSHGSLGLTLGQSASSLPGSCPQLPWGCLGCSSGKHYPDIVFPQFPCFFHAPGMTHLWLHQCHCGQATTAQSHLFCHFPLSSRSVSAMWVQHCLQGFMVQESLLATSLLSIPTGSCLPGCWDAQSMPSFLQMVTPVQISAMLPLISTGSSRPTRTEGRSRCFWTQGSKGELLCPASHRGGMLGPLFCRWKFLALLGASLSQNHDGLDGK